MSFFFGVGNYLRVKLLLRWVDYRRHNEKQEAADALEQYCFSPGK